VKSIAITTIGCRLNQAESAEMAGQLRGLGWRVVTDPEQADCILVHSCTITANAYRKSVQACRKARKKRPQAMVAVAGCAVQVDSEGIRRESGADLALNQEQKKSAGSIIDSEWLRLQGLPPREEQAVSAATSQPFFNRTRATVKVQDGCDFRCSYCVVPEARGPAVSRSPDEVLDEIDSLAEHGFREIVLTGANLGCYHYGRTSLVKLIERIEEETYAERIRLSSIEPTTVEEEIVDYMSTSRRLCRFLHVPLQNGDDSVLQKMGRRYSTADYIRFVNRATDVLGDFGLGTDIIAGHPGETAEAFRNTLEVVEELPFSNIHAFSYSKRPGTVAADMTCQVPAPTAASRVNALKQKAARKKEEFARRFVGRECSVLVEKITPDNLAKGWTGEYLEARLPCPDARPNDIITFVPCSATGGKLAAQT
jgi:threonylcarbamoyladenosine tRNA methylthiotransferase MtaB